MNREEQKDIIDIMTEVINKDEMHKDMMKYGIYYVPFTSCAESLCDKGYQKIVWHRVADGDLPKPNTDILFLSVLPSGSQFYDLGVYSYVEKFWYGNRCTTTTDKVIAWTELPTYEE